LISATFLVLDYGDVIYMHAASTTLHTLDTVYHGTLRFIKVINGNLPSYL